MDHASGTTDFLLRERETLRAEVAQLKRLLATRGADGDWERTFDAVPVACARSPFPASHQTPDRTDGAVAPLFS